jgi:hypothetical protein
MLAAAMGVEVLYRRDSDHVVDVWAGKPAYPSVLEAGAIGRTLDTVTPIVSVNQAKSHQISQAVNFVGSGMFESLPITVVT